MNADVTNEEKRTTRLLAGKDPVVVDVYTPEQRARRDASGWTLVQGILAPLQFLVFMVSAWLVCRYLITGEGYTLATWSVLVKTFLLYTIMVTGALWERDVFGQYLFAPMFFWEDVVSMLVIALHTFYVWALLFDVLSPQQLMGLALLAYATYVVNAAQFILKFKRVRQGRPGNSSALAQSSARKQDTVRNQNPAKWTVSES